MTPTQDTSIVETKVVLSQESDSCQDNNSLGQLLTLQTYDAGAGNYLVLETARWAVDDLEEFIRILREFWAEAVEGKA